MHAGQGDRGVDDNIMDESSLLHLP